MAERLGGPTRQGAGEASDEAKAKIEEQIAHLKTQWDQGAAKRQEILDAADDKWEEIKDEAEAKWEEVKVGVKDTVERIKSYFA